MSGRDEFYVGYVPAAPPGVARHVRRVVVFLLAAALGLPVLVVLAHGPFAAATFEFGNVRELSGVIHERPVPTLAVGPPGGATVRFLVVSTGKRGAAKEVEGLDGRTVTLRGTLVYREGRTVVELQPGSLRARDDAASPSPGPVRQELGAHTLRGEIVDIKCYAGVMNPGSGKTHRACAARCISGGIPPVLVVRDEQGRAGYFALVGPDGGSIGGDLLDRIAEPVSVTGRVERHDDLLVLRADPADIARVE